MLKGFNEVVDFALEQEEAGIKSYQSYWGNTDNQGLKQLLRSLIEQEKEHVRRLMELKKMGDMDKLFTSTRLEVESSKFITDLSYHSEMSSPEFLMFVIEKKGMAVRLYQYLESMTGGSELAFLFRRLANDELKAKSIAQNRYELEALSRQ